MELPSLFTILQKPVSDVLHGVSSCKRVWRRHRRRTVKSRGRIFLCASCCEEEMDGGAGWAEADCSFPFLSSSESVLFNIAPTSSELLFPTSRRRREEGEADGGEGVRDWSLLLPEDGAPGLPHRASRRREPKEEPPPPLLVPSLLQRFPPGPGLER